jgi:hypothetical protein
MIHSSIKTGIACLIAKEFPFVKDFHRISGKSFAIMVCLNSARRKGGNL